MAATDRSLPIVVRAAAAWLVDLARQRDEARRICEDNTEAGYRALAERDAAVKAGNIARRERDKHAKEILRLQAQLAESANTIAALHKAADEHTKENARLSRLAEDAQADHRDAFGVAQTEFREHQALIKAVRDYAAELAGGPDHHTLIADRLRALLASPTSSESESTEVRDGD